ncbi:hypothetical protein RJ640_015667 [Escallonia rubra]|uniref:FAR1 domain-containing protein n=1 Tax=Escallonia rubra TaxID=112253 RepID=A0AA88UB33_9ASTE|nr:hypothetical protein RJ640_015667 [Escallonia rubra]
MSKLIEQIDENEYLTDHDILDTHVHNELEIDDCNVWGLSHCDGEVETRKENETYGSFEDFNSEHIDGKTFDTQEATYEFYNQYDLLNGFGTRKHNAHKIMATGAIFRRLNGNEKRRRDLRTGCEAMMQVTLSKSLGMWVVDKFQDVHNHPLTTTPSKVIRHRSHSKYHRTNVCKSLVADLNNEGLRSSQISGVVTVMKPNEEADQKKKGNKELVHIVTGKVITGLVAQSARCYFGTLLAGDEDWLICGSVGSPMWRLFVTAIADLAGDEMAWQ